MRLIDSLVQRVLTKAEGAHHCTSFKTCAFGMALALWLAIPLSASALTVSGSLTVNTVWTNSQSPVTLHGNVILDQDATLTIEPGVEIRMAPSASFTLLRGAVQAVGTQSQPIVITSSKANPAPGDWGVWRFSEGTRSPQTRWDHVRVEYGSGIVIDKSSPTLHRVAIRFHNGPAIQTDLESSPVGQGLRAEGNTLNAVVVPAGVIAGQVTWGLVGIPYFVEQGLVEVGASQMTIEPAELRLAPSSTWLMRLVLKQPVPPGGRVVSLSNGGSGSIGVPSTLNLPEGALGADFAVSSSRFSGDSTGFVTAVHPDLGTATAKVQVSLQSVVELSVRYTTMLVNGPYTAKVSLSRPAPAGGLTVVLASSPAGALQHPTTVVVPQGDTSAEFTVTGNLPHAGAYVSAKADGYFSGGGVDLRFVNEASVRLDYNDTVIVVGEETDLQLMPVVPPAPRDGLGVQVSSSNPGVLTVTPNETVVAGQEFYPSHAPSVKFKGISPGVARIQLSGPGVAPDSRDVSVRKPTVLALESVSDNGKITLGQGLVGYVRIRRQIDADSYHGSGDLWVTLRCEDAAICTGQQVHIPRGSNVVTTTVAGEAAGVTKLIVEASRAVTGTADITVVKPQWAWQSPWSDDYDSYEPTLDARRFVSARHGFRICLSVPEAAPYNRQKWNGAELLLSLSLVEQVPAGLVSAFYAQESGGVPISQARIENGHACTEPLYVGEATQRGRYRMGSTAPDGTVSQSKSVQVRADDQIEVAAGCGDCTEMVVVEGFSAKFDVYATHLGNRVSPTSPIDVQLRCADPATCISQSTVQILSNNQASVEVAGHASGETYLEATATNLLNIYPEVGTGKISVVKPALSLNGEVWDKAETPVEEVGKNKVYEVCISEPRREGRSYPISDLQVGLISSNPAVARPAQAAMTWPAGVPCIYVEMQFISIGDAVLTANVPGVPPHSTSFIVQP